VLVNILGEYESVCVCGCVGGLNMCVCGCVVYVCVCVCLDRLGK